MSFYFWSFYYKRHFYLYDTHMDEDILMYPNVWKKYTFKNKFIIFTFESYFEKFLFKLSLFFLKNWTLFYLFSIVIDQSLKRYIKILWTGSTCRYYVVQIEMYTCNVGTDIEFPNFQWKIHQTKGKYQRCTRYWHNSTATTTKNQSSSIKK